MANPSKPQSDLYQDALGACEEIFGVYTEAEIATQPQCIQEAWKIGKRTREAGFLSDGSQNRPI